MIFERNEPGVGNGSGLMWPIWLAEDSAHARENAVCLSPAPQPPVSSAHARENAYSFLEKELFLGFLRAREEERGFRPQLAGRPLFPPRTRGRTPDHRRDGSRGAVTRKNGDALPNEIQRGFPPRTRGRTQNRPRTIFPNAGIWCIFRRCPKILLLGHRRDGRTVK